MGVCVWGGGGVRTYGTQHGAGWVGVGVEGGGGKQDLGRRSRNVNLLMTVVLLLSHTCAIPAAGQSQSRTSTEWRSAPSRTQR